jgi:hypothetical protein
MADYVNEIKRIYRSLNDLMHAGKFDEVVKILEELDIPETSPTLLVTYVSAAYMARNEYPEAYAKFFYEVEDILQIIGEPDALFGLEPKVKEETQ